jgi:glutamine synthetase type III
VTTKQSEKAEVDRLWTLDNKLAPFKSDIYERDKLRKKIAARFDDEDATKSFIAPGETTPGVEVSARTNRRDFKPGALKKLATFLGELFWPLAKVSMEDFEDHVTILDRDKYVVESQSGYRYVKAIPSPASVNKKAA